jgi:hypothetical protein
MATTLTIRTPDAGPIDIEIDQQFYIDLMRAVIMPLIIGFDPTILALARIPCQVILSRGTKLAKEGKCNPPAPFGDPLRHEFGPIGYAAFYGLYEMIGSEHVTLCTIEGDNGTHLLRLTDTSPIDIQAESPAE